jgi:hypothetical protein
MTVSIVVPALASEAHQLSACLGALVSQRHDHGPLEVFVAQYGVGSPLQLPADVSPSVTLIATNHASPYAARNLAAAASTGDVLLFTEPVCVAEPGWVAAHVATLGAPGVTVSVGHVSPAARTHPLDVFLSYEQVRDAWVFSCSSWRHYFGRPKNMGIARDRFRTHGPFAEVARGSDSTFVQRVARERSCAEVVWSPEAVVRQQTVCDLRSCFRDRFEHSVALQRHQSSHAAPIAFGQRARLFRDAARQRHYGPVDTLMMLALLGAGVVVFRCGGWRGAVVRARSAS